MPAAADRPTSPGAAHGRTTAVFKVADMKKAHKVLGALDAKPKKPKNPTAKKAANVKKKAKKDAAVVGKQKADAGKTKPRLDREQGYKEILKALRTAGGPCGRKAL